jgi:IclR family transcriptional regulator, KDG regulon repressor
LGGAAGDGVALRASYVQRDQSHYAVQSLDRAIDVLEAFGHGESERGVAELARELDLPRATVHRLLAALTHRGLMSQDARTGKYRLGLKLFELGSLVANSLDVRRVAHPYLVDLVKHSGETAHLVVLDGTNIVFVDKVETDNPFRMVSQIGGRLPARHSGSGKALLAQLSDDELGRAFAEPRGTADYDVDLAALRAHLKLVRARGWAMDDQETQAGLRCVGTVIRDHTGGAVAGLSISGPIVRISDARVPELVQLLCASAEAISHAIGYRKPVTGDG